MTEIDVKPGEPLHVASAKRWPSPRVDRPEVVYDNDEGFHALYDEALAATQMTERAMRRQRHFLIPQTLRRVAHVPGDAAEIGCFRGLSAYLACSTFEDLGLDVAFHLFDSFEGLSEPASTDHSDFRPAPKPDGGNPFACSEERVRENLSAFPSVEYYKGWVPARFNEVADRRFRYVHIDVDLFEPTWDSVEFFWPRLAPGGAMVLDDYGTLYYPGARLALDAFFAGRTDVAIVESPSGGAVATKLHPFGPAYGRALPRWAGKVAFLAKAFGSSPILDVGLAHGLLATCLPGRSVVSRDLYDDDLGEAVDFVVCADRLERTPDAAVDAALDRLRRVTGRCAFLAIATHSPEIAQGDPALRPAAWWRARIETWFDIVDWVDAPGELTCVAAPLERSRPAASGEGAPDGVEGAFSATVLRTVAAYGARREEEAARALESARAARARARGSARREAQAALRARAGDDLVTELTRELAVKESSLAVAERSVSDLGQRLSEMERRAEAAEQAASEERSAREAAEAAAAEAGAQSADAKRIASDLGRRLLEEGRRAETAEREASDARSAREAAEAAAAEAGARSADAERVASDLGERLRDAARRAGMADLRASTAAATLAQAERRLATASRLGRASRIARDGERAEPWSGPASNGRIAGAVTRVSAEAIEGWVTPPRRLAPTPLVRCLVDGRLTCTVVAGRLIPGDQPGEDRLSFFMPLADVEIPGQPSRVRLRVVGDVQDMHGSPLLLRRTPSGVVRDAEDPLDVRAHEQVPTLGREPATRDDNSERYAGWVRRFDSPDDEERRRMSAFAADPTRRRPSISVIVLGASSCEHRMRRTLASVEAQVLAPLEVVMREPAAVEAAAIPIRQVAAGDVGSLVRQARGDAAVFLIAGDELAPGALLHGADLMAGADAPLMVVPDEDVVEPDGSRRDPWFKGAFDPDRAAAQDCLSRGLFFDLSVARSLPAADGADEPGAYRFALRLLAAAPGANVARCPFVLYHKAAGARAVDGDEAETARLAADMVAARTGSSPKRVEPTGDSLRRIVFPRPVDPPLVSIVIPTRDRVDLLRGCVSGLLGRTRYGAIEVVIVDNGSRDPEALRYLAEIPGQDRRVRVLSFDGAFDYSAINNWGVEQSSGGLIALLNNDIDVIDEHWLSEMVSHAVRPDIGAVGAKLLYGDGAVQHAGVTLGIGLASHLYKGAPRDDPGPHGSLLLAREVSAVTAACLLMRRDVWDLVGGLSTEFPVAYNDVDLCLRVRRAGFRVIWTPFACLHHLESASRGLDATSEKRARLDADKARMSERWGDRLSEDPFYSPNLSVRAVDGRPAIPPRVSPPWADVGREAGAE